MYGGNNYAFMSQNIKISSIESDNKNEGAY